MTYATIADDLRAKIEALPAFIERSPEILLRGRDANAEFLVEIGMVSYHMSVAAGRLACQRGPQLMRSWSFAVRGEEEAWRRFWRPLPPPRYHDIFALAKFGAFRIEGDFRPLMTHLLYFKAVLAAPRRLTQDAGR